MVGLNDAVVAWGLSQVPPLDTYNDAKRALVAGRSPTELVAAAGVAGLSWNEALLWLAQNSSSFPAVLADAVLWLDPSESVAGEQVAVNRGSAGAVLNARYGSTAGADTNDPLWLSPALFDDRPFLRTFMNGGGLNLNSAAWVAASGVTSCEAVWHGIIHAFDATDGVISYGYVGAPGAGGLNSVLFSGAGSGSAAITGAWRVNKTAAQGGGFFSYAFGAGGWWLCGQEIWVKWVVTAGVGTQCWSSSDGVSWVLRHNYSEPTIGFDNRTNAFAGSLGSRDLGLNALDATIFDGIFIVNGVEQHRFGAAQFTVGEVANQVLDDGGAVWTVIRPTSGRKPLVVNKPVWLFGTDDYLEVPDNPLLNPGASGSLTVMIVHRQWDTEIVSGELLSKRAAVAVATAGWNVRNATIAERTLFQVSDGTVMASPAALPSRASGELGVVWGVLDRTNSQVRSFWNNNAATVEAFSGGSAVAGDPLRIGARTGVTPSLFVDMECYGVAVWDRVLTAEEILSVNEFFGVV